MCRATSRASPNGPGASIKWRPVDSVAFYLGRDDFRVYRSKELADMLQSMDKHSRSVILFAHRNSKLILSHNVPRHFRVVYFGKLGLCDMAVIER